MKTQLCRFLLIVLLASVAGTAAKAEELKKITSLSGTWKFSIGDDMAWAAPSFDDSSWDKISVPSPWEEQGYRDYNGYAWYRRSFSQGDVPANTVIYLLAGRIDDADEVYLNGKLIGKSGKFPPDFETAYNYERKYIIPAGALKANGENVIAIRVYESYNEGGIIDGRTGIYYDEDIDLLSINLSGTWKFHKGNNMNWKTPAFNDDDWKTINVPDKWENQGYPDYDGYAWYRIKFSIPAGMETTNLYLVLGKIDDEDDVYLNGDHIGSVYDLRRDFGFTWGDGWQYNTRRIYKIPNGLLNTKGLNTLAVKVYDGQGDGGIYEGPIGIMTSENGRIYKSRNHYDQNFWEYVYDKIFN